MPKQQEKPLTNNNKVQILLVSLSYIGKAIKQVLTCTTTAWKQNGLLPRAPVSRTNSSIYRSFVHNRMCNSWINLLRSYIQQGVVHVQLCEEEAQKHAAVLKADK